MKWLRRLLWTVALVAALAVAGFVGLYVWLSNPGHAPLPLPPGLIALGTAEGQALLATSIKVDHAALGPMFQAQQKRSWCGVASAVMTLSALRGAPMRQDALFTAATDEVRTWSQITFGGMPLDDLAALLRAHGVHAEAHHADEGVAAFRAMLQRNLAAPGDFVIVNWRRDVLGMDGVEGHLSPVSAYDPASDRVLILDVAAHVYPNTWAPVERLFAAMDTLDGDVKRGWVEVRE